MHQNLLLFQMNFPSIIGFYGDYARMRALELLDRGWYVMVGSDCYRFHALRKQCSARELKKSTIGKLSEVMDSTDAI